MGEGLSEIQASRPHMRKSQSEAGCSGADWLSPSPSPASRFAPSFLSSMAEEGNWRTPNRHSRGIPVFPPANPADEVKVADASRFAGVNIKISNHLPLVLLSFSFHDHDDHDDVVHTLRVYSSANTTTGSTQRAARRPRNLDLDR